MKLNTLSIGKSSKPNQCKVQMQSRCIFRLHWSILLTSIFMMCAAVREQKEAMKRGLIRAGRYRLRIFLLASFTKGMHVMLNTAREWRKKKLPKSHTIDIDDTKILYFMIFVVFLPRYAYTYTYWLNLFCIFALSFDMHFHTLVVAQVLVEAIIYS